MAEGVPPTQQGGSPQGPTATDAPRPAGSRPKKKKAVSAASVVCLLIGVAGVLVVGYYWGEVRNFVSLQPWAKSAPCRAIDAFVQAVSSGDAAKVRALVDESSIAVGDENGRVTTLSRKGSMAPPVSAERLVPGASAVGAPVKYDFTDVRGVAKVVVKAADGHDILFVLKRAKGSWRIVDAQAGLAPEGAGPAASP